MAAASVGKFNIGILHKQVAAFIVASLVPLAVLWGIERSTIRTDAEANIDQNLQQKGEYVVKAVDDWVDRNLSQLRAAARLPALHGDAAQQRGAVLAITSEMPWSLLVHTIGADGYNMARSDDKAPIYYGDRAYFTGPMHGDSEAWELIMSRTANKPALSLSVPVLNDKNQPASVLGSVSELSAITKVVVGQNVGRTGYSYLITKDGKLVAHPGEHFEKSLIDYSNDPAFMLAARGQTGIVHYKLKDRDVISSIQRTKLGWICVVQQDADEAFEQVRATDQRALILLSVTAIIVLAFSVTMARGLVKPLLHLTEVSERISRGQFDHQLDETKRGDEIGALARAIERLATSTNMALDRLRRPSKVG
jgi:methyl-accepting chemotaxis protein